MFDSFYKLVLGSILRSALVAFGAWNLKEGFLDADQVKEMVATGVMMGGVAWSIWQKYGHSVVKAQVAQIADLSKREPELPVRTAALVASQKTGKALALLLACGLTLFALDDARAADVNVPVAKSVLGFGTPCTPLSCTGFYAGFSISGNGSNADIIGNGINGSVFAGGVIPSLDVGYLYREGSWLLGAEVGLGYQMGSSVSVNGIGGNDNGVFAYQVVKAGGDLSALLGTQQPIAIPPLLANTVIAPYVQLGIAEHSFAGSWASGFASGAGVLFDIGPHAFLDVSYLNVQYSVTSGALSIGPQNIVKAGFGYKF